MYVICCLTVSRAAPITFTVSWRIHLESNSLVLIVSPRRGAGLPELPSGRML